MDDLSGLDWSQTSTNPSKKLSTIATGNYYPSLRPTPPLSGRSTPLQPKNNLSAPSNPPSKSSTPVNDSFANLVTFSASGPAKDLSLQEQQKLIEDQKAKVDAEREKQFDAHFGTGDATARENLGAGQIKATGPKSPPNYTGTNEYGGQRLSNAINKPFASLDQASEAISRRPVDEADLLSVFESSAPVDTSSNYPVSSELPEIDDGDDTFGNGYPKADAADGFRNPTLPGEDLFGLGTTAVSSSVRNISAPGAEEDDDVLGLLGRPVSELATPNSNGQFHTTISSNEYRPEDKAIAELVDMGFPLDRSRDALATTESGVDVQAAVGWLLNQAHAKSLKKAQKSSLQGPVQRDGASSVTQNNAIQKISDAIDPSMPTWMRQQSRSNSTQRREDSRSPASGERDPAKIATDLGNNLFKTANSLWKTGTKKLNQAVSDLNSDSDTSQPKWMRDGSVESREPRTKQQRRPSEPSDNVSRDEKPASRRKPSVKQPDITDEALMLESRDTRSQPRRSAQQPTSHRNPQQGDDSSRDSSPSMSNLGRDHRPVQPRFMHQSSATTPRSRLSRQAVEEQSSEAYISPARRKKAPPRSPSLGPNLISDTSQPSISSSLQTSRSAAPSSRAAPRPVASASIPTRPRAPQRTIPSLAPTALQAATTHRQSGTQAFKLGNYTSATASYTAALSILPSTHPLTIPLLTNRSLTHLKTGDPKASIADAEAVIAFIGPGRGADETIDSSNSSEANKPMAEYWGKAQMRRAEALEQLERWTDAVKVWTECVEAGVGGSTSIQGRNRCEQALRPQPAPMAKKPPPKPKPIRSSALNDLSGNSISSSNQASNAEAVNRLRAANLDAEKVEDEKFALADSIDARIVGWRKGKEGNLRALLGSLDTVLWEGSGWKKVGMGELIVPGKVKVVYMKGIGRVHPDKVRETH